MAITKDVPGAGLHIYPLEASASSFQSMIGRALQLAAAVAIGRLLSSLRG